MELLPILIAILGIAAGWVLVFAMLRRLRSTHPTVYFSQLGAPSFLQLAGSKVWLSRWRLQWRFLRFVYCAEFLKLGDPRLSAMGVAAIAANVGAIVLVFSAASVAK
jgi:hypothetical protein